MFVGACCRKGLDHPFGDQKPIVTFSVHLPAESGDAKRQVYVVPLPEPGATNRMAAPTYMIRMDFVSNLLRACAAPSGDCPQRAHLSTVIEYAAALHEMHKENVDGVFHGRYHAAVNGLSSFRLAP